MENIEILRDGWLGSDPEKILTVNSNIFIQSVEFELPNMYTVSSVFPPPISIFTTNKKKIQNSNNKI